MRAKPAFVFLPGAMVIGDLLTLLYLTSEFGSSRRITILPDGLPSKSRQNSVDTLSTHSKSSDMVTESLPGVLRHAFSWSFCVRLD